MSFAAEAEGKFTDMANALYTLGRQKFLSGDLDADAHDLRVILIDLASYTPNLATDEFLDDIAGGARVAVSGALTSKTTTGGVLDAANVPFTAVTGASVEALVLYRHTGVDATSPLIAYFDTGTGLPFTPSGADFTVVWDDGANKIFKL